jgi:signal transduction histidine kinase
VGSAKQNVPFEINPVRGVDIRDVVRSATEQAAASVEKADKVELEMRLPKQPLKSDIDPVNMERAVTNLVKNAFEAAKLKVIVSAHRNKSGQVIIGVDDDGQDEWFRH